jgi:hypothetical protein
MADSRGPSLAIVGIAVVFLASLPFLIPTVIWLVLTGYAITKAIGTAPDSASPTSVLLAVVAIVTFFTLAIAGAIWAIGRSMTPSKDDRTTGAPELPA